MYFAFSREAKYCDDCVCLCVCLSLHERSSATTQQYAFNLHRIFCACFWPWLGPPLLVLRYVMYFWFYGWSYLYIMGICTVEVLVGRTNQPDGAASMGLGG